MKSSSNARGFLDIIALYARYAIEIQNNKSKNFQRVLEIAREYQCWNEIDAMRCAAKQADYMNPGCRFSYNDKGTWAAKIATTDSHYMWMCMHIAHIHTHKHILNGTIQKYLTNERAVSCSFSFYCCTLSFCFVLACHRLTMQCHTPYAIPYHALPCLVLWCPFAKRALRFFFLLIFHSPCILPLSIAFVVFSMLLHTE